MTSAFWKQLQVRTLTKVRDWYFTVPEVRRAQDIYMVLPQLSYSVVQVKVVEEQVAMVHEHHCCQPGCSTNLDWTPIVRIMGEATEIHLDSTMRLFNSLEEAYRTVRKAKQQ